MTSLGTGCNRNERGGYLSFDLERHLLVKPDLKLKTISVFFLNVVAVKYPRTRTLQIITFVQDRQGAKFVAETGFLLRC